MERIRKGIDLDKLGSLASFLCVIHCVLTGFFVSLLPIIGAQFMSSIAAEFAFFGTAGIIGGFAIVRGYRKHRSATPGVIFALGLTTIIVGHAVFLNRSGANEALMSIIGGSMLITFHVMNSRLPKVCDCEYCAPTE